MFTKKKLEVHVTLASSTYANGMTTKVMRDIPITAEIEKAGFPSRDSAKIKIFGISSADMEAMSFLAFRPMASAPNVIEIYVGDEREMSLAYMGDIISAVPVFQEAPDVFLEIDALSAYYAGLVAVPPYSFKGSVPISTILAQLSKQIGVSFVNKNRSGQSATNPVLEGSAVQQLIRLGEEYKLNIVLSNGVLTWLPQAGSGVIVARLSKDSGLFGYPSLTSNGVSLTAEYINNMALGDLVQVSSVVPRASGVWQVVGLHHQLGQLVDNAPWTTKIDAVFAE